MIRMPQWFVYQLNLFTLSNCVISRGVLYNLASRGLAHYSCMRCMWCNFISSPAREFAHQLITEDGHEVCSTIVAELVWSSFTSHCQYYFQ
jgi:uncharacterized membrane protein YagU involved in acid resistance